MPRRIEEGQPVLVTAHYTPANPPSIGHSLKVYYALRVNDFEVYAVRFMPELNKFHVEISQGCEPVNAWAGYCAKRDQVYIEAIRPPHQVLWLRWR